MDEIVAQIIELISNADQAVDNIDQLQTDIDHVLENVGAQALEEYSGYLVSACNLLAGFQRALEGDDRPAHIAEVLSVGDVELSNDNLIAMVEEHSDKLTELCPDGVSTAGIVSYVTEQLRDTYNELVDQNGRGWSGSDDIRPKAILDRINSLRHEVCTASEQFNNVVNTLTLRQYRDFLVETSAALKDVVIVGADIVLATTDITLLTAAKSGFSIFTGVRSLGSRIGRYAERVSEFFSAR